VPAQAMALGKPVIATAWSGNLDFMNKNNSALVSYSLIPVHDPEGAFQSDNQMWADANVEEAADWLRRLAGDAELRARMGAAAAKDIAAQLAPQQIARKTAALIEAGERR
jgi:glycosyltransferase involved in cell wall biosynthesis